MDRKSFFKKTVMGGLAMGYSGMISHESFSNPKNALSRPSGLKITDIRGATLASIYDFPIIKIYTNQGIIGLGEVRDAGWIGQALMLKPYLVGKDPLDIETILMSIRHLTGPGRFAGGYCAVDIALMDIAGKALGVPCWKLLGEKVRDKVEIYADCPTVLKEENLKLMMKRRLDLGLKHFPKLNTLRIWFSYDAHVADPKRFLPAAKRAAELLAERKIKMIPVIFNGWRSLVDFGGFTREQLNQSLRNKPVFGSHRQYLCELIEAIRPAGNLLMYDISNEPFNGGGKEKGSIELRFLEAMAQQIRELDSKTPVSVGTQGCPGVGGPEDLNLIDSFVDVHAVHPIGFPISRRRSTRRTSRRWSNTSNGWANPPSPPSVAGAPTMMPRG
jgi:hypothetical protein